MQLSTLFTTFPTTHAVYLETLYAEETEVLVQLSPGEYLLGPAEVFLQVCLHLLSAAGREGGREGGRERQKGNKTDATEPS